MRSICSAMTICADVFRKKKLNESSIGQSSLARVLTTFDLTALGVGSTLGVGIYVLSGDVSKSVAGPAVVISFLFAAITSAFAGLCYAEFGARVPKAGSAYVYTYYCVGELVAFVIGWTLILEYTIGAASVSRGISTYVDSMVSSKIKANFMIFAPMDNSFMSSYVDFFAFGLCLILAGALAYGVKESATINNFLTFCNLSVVAFVVISGLFKADMKNWNIPKNELPALEAGEGGFMPFGFLGIIKGAAICFYGFVGFDCIATTGEEVKNPQKAIPTAILLTLMIVFIAYFCMSSVLTLMWPYYLQNEDAPLPHVYEELGWYSAKWLVSVGALFGMFSSLYGAMFPLPRIIYAMASDGIIFRRLGQINRKTKTPVLATLLGGLLTATAAALFNLHQLISLLALGTLLAYTIVAISVVILRYTPDQDDDYKEIDEPENYDKICSLWEMFRHYYQWGCNVPTSISKKIVTFNILIFTAGCIILAHLLNQIKQPCDSSCKNSAISIIILLVFLTLILMSISSQPKSRKNLTFQMPLMPLLPALNIFFNMYLISVLNPSTWIKFAIWMTGGIIPYACWYVWKYCHGEVNESSLYNVNRTNTIKYNEMVRKLLLDRKIFLQGLVNEGFDDGEKEKKLISLSLSIKSIDSNFKSHANEMNHYNPRKNSSEKNKYDCFNEIITLNEYQQSKEFAEINNNSSIRNKQKIEHEDEKWRSVAEIHAVLEDENNGEQLQNQERNMDESEMETSDERVKSHSENVQTENNFTFTKSRLEKNESEKNYNASDRDGTTLAAIDESKLPESNISVNPKNNSGMAEGSNQSEIVKEMQCDCGNLTARLSKRKSKRNLRSNFMRSKTSKNGETRKHEENEMDKADSHVIKSLGADDSGDPKDSDSVPSGKAKANRMSKLINKEMCEKLSEIIQEQASFLQSGSRATSVAPQPVEQGTTSPDSGPADIPTLTKSEIVNKLQILLTRRSPTKNALRNSFTVHKPC